MLVCGGRAVWVMGANVGVFDKYVQWAPRVDRCALRLE